MNGASTSTRKKTPRVELPFRNTNSGCGNCWLAAVPTDTTIPSTKAAAMVAKIAP